MIPFLYLQHIVIYGLYILYYILLHSIMLLNAINIICY